MAPSASAHDAPAARWLPSAMGPVHYVVVIDWPEHDGPVALYFGVSLATLSHSREFGSSRNGRMRTLSTDLPAWHAHEF